MSPDAAPRKRKKRVVVIVSEPPTEAQLEHIRRLEAEDLVVERVTERSLIS